MDDSESGGFTYFPCPPEGATSHATLPATRDHSIRIKGIAPLVSYGELPLTFTSIAPAGGSVCTVRSNAGELPVNIFGYTVVHSVTVATLDFLPGDDLGTQVPACTFAGLQGLANDPLESVTTWTGKLGSHGTATSKFGVKGSSLTPVVIAHESATRTRVEATIKFTLKSAGPFKLASVTWSFGDGTTTKQYPGRHAYKKPGKYKPSAKITNSAGHSVTLKLPPITITKQQPSPGRTTSPNVTSRNRHLTLAYKGGMLLGSDVAACSTRGHC